MNTKDEKQPVKKVIEIMRSHLVATWAIVSCLFALIIHILFEIPAPNEWFDPEWEAGDLLTYASTVALGLLAIWQNQKFKEENDKAQELMDAQNTAAQERFERISMKANELSAISRIADLESEYIRSLNEALENFYKECDLNGRLFEWGDPDSASGAIISSGHRIIESYEHVKQLLYGGYCLRQYDIKEFCKQCETLQSRAIHIINNHLQTKDERIEGLPELIEAQLAFVTSKRKYLSMRQRALYHILFEEMTLDEIRALYIAPEDSVNGENENGVG